MSSVAIKITNNAEFRGVEKYLLIGGAYWNGKTRNEMYNYGKVLYFNEQGMKGHRTTDERYPTHYFITLSQDDLQMNMYAGTAAAEQNIRRAGYMFLTVEDVKKTVKVNNCTPQQYFSVLMGGDATIGSGDVDISRLFGMSNRGGSKTVWDIWEEHHDSMNDEVIKQKSAPNEYINMFEVADIVNTTTKTTTTKLLKLMGTQNIKSSGGIKVQVKTIMKSDK